MLIKSNYHDDATNIDLPVTPILPGTPLCVAGPMVFGDKFLGNLSTCSAKVWSHIHCPTQVYHDCVNVFLWFWFRTHVYTHTHTHKYPSGRLYIYIYIYIYIMLQMYISYISLSLYIYIYIHLCVCACFVCAGAENSSVCLVFVYITHADI